MYSKSGEIRRDETCLDFSGHDVVLYPCHGAKGNQLWLYDPNVSFTVVLSNSNINLSPIISEAESVGFQ